MHPRARGDEDVSAGSSLRPVLVGRGGLLCLAPGSVEAAELTRRLLRCGVSKSYLWNLGSRKQDKRPSAQVLCKIDKGLGVTLADLLDQTPTVLEQRIEPSLREFAETQRLTDSDVRMLASIQFRGDPPRPRVAGFILRRAHRQPRLRRRHQPVGQADLREQITQGTPSGTPSGRDSRRGTCTGPPPVRYLDKSPRVGRRCRERRPRAVEASCAPHGAPLTRPAVPGRPPVAACAARRPRRERQSC